MTLPAILENQSLYRPTTSTYTSGTVSSLSQIGILLFGVTNANGHEYRVVGDKMEYDAQGQLLKARWAIVEGSARRV